MFWIGLNFLPPFGLIDEIDSLLADYKKPEDLIPFFDYPPKIRQIAYTNYPSPELIGDRYAQNSGRITQYLQNLTRTWAVNIFISCEI
jgi:hypothetical protein